MRKGRINTTQRAKGANSRLGTMEEQEAKEAPSRDTSKEREGRQSCVFPVVDDKRDDAAGFAPRDKNRREHGQSTAETIRREDLKIKIANAGKNTMLSNEYAEKLKDIDAPKESEEGE